MSQENLGTTVFKQTPEQGFSTSLLDLQLFAATANRRFTDCTEQPNSEDFHTLDNIESHLRTLRKSMEAKKGADHG